MTLITLIVMGHCIVFCIFVKNYALNSSHYSIKTMLLPILLLVIYPIVIIPFVLVTICQDLAIKGEGVLCWHRDSLGELLQRFILCILILACIIIFENCIDNHAENGQCIGRSLIPLTLPFCCVLCKVICLRSQRMFLMGGFVVCALAQMLVMFVVNFQFKNKKNNGNLGLKVWLMFIPAMIFGLLCDIEIIKQLCIYKPVAFVKEKGHI